MRLLFLFIFTIFTINSYANLNAITWKGVYYNPLPNQKNITQAYCDAHNPGILIHVVKKPYSRTLITDKHIKLDRSTFHIKKKNGIYFIYGDFYAHKNHWQDHIYYRVYKLTEAGVTRGFWYSDKCKGFYLGTVVKNNNHVTHD